MKLNLGCGIYPLKDFINIDSQPLYGDRHDDILKINLPLGQATEMYAGHVIEHLTWTTIVPALKHWHDLLMPTGTLTLTFPDFQKAYQLYLDGSTTHESLNGIVYGNDDVQTIEGLHKLLVSVPYVLAWLNEAGYSDAQEVDTSPYAVANHVAWQSIIVAQA